MKKEKAQVTIKTSTGRIIEKIGKLSPDQTLLAILNWLYLYDDKFSTKFEWRIEFLKFLSDLIKGK